MAEPAEAVNQPVVAETTPTESAPVENNTVTTDNALDDDAFDDIDDEVSQDTDSDEDTSNATDETKADQSQGEEKPLAPKSENRFQQLANDNRQLKEQIEQLKMREAQFANEQGLLNEINPETGDYFTPQEVERIAFQQSREAQQQSIAQQRYGLEVQQNQQVIDQQAGQALKDFPMFNRFIPGTESTDPYTGEVTGTKNPDFNQELAAEAAQILSSALIYDNNGTLVGSSIQPYQFYKTIADSAKRAEEKARTIGQAQAQKATEKMLANSDTLGGRPTEPSKDTDIDDFDKGWDN